ncbi:uncharacterized protein FOMMEDRAFT_104560 [Fomitiporia mediterranea MF3/22]|uniref:uncharacterized protein n=1 Tax=Fomitiporia mediterranea (strain MF3/22) TaxID=694068 RepID=UPI00044091D4|nr:uncharacterized protein FOMMEDRAFT_104560 [Fomitiporia mediterranea MF3/22]EJD06088.1 hypothetical protein FOMMEDRAFT_104560 [Fomitiporia mediterranea MF3/22]
MAWKLFLIPTVPLTPPASQSPAKPPLEALKVKRKGYTSLLLEKMRAPDGSYEESFSIPGVEELPRPSEMRVNLQRDNPLSLHEDNPWKEWFTAVELRKTIRQDVERTFPDHDYFRDSDVQAQLTHILYVYSVTHPDIGYRQGMHELLAPLFHAVDYDSLLPAENEDPGIIEFCSRTWVAADAWTLFDVVMDGMRSWYEWREPTPPPMPAALQTQYRHGPPEGQLELKPYVAPIVIACQKLQSQMLRAADPQLWQGMQKAGVEPQIYGIRWLRLLFTREFSLPDAMMLWDGIFSCDGSFELVPWICVAMLIRIRNQLIPAEYSVQLTFLLRYPSPPSDIDPSCPNPAILLLRQAFALYTAPNPSTGASIAIENRNLLNIPLDVPEPLRSPIRTRPPPTRPRSSTDAHKAGPSKVPQGQHRPVPQSQSLQMGFPELLARGLFERGESLGINKTVMNAVSEIRKNIPDLTSQLMRSPSVENVNNSSFPLITEHPPEERPPWEHRSRFEMEKDVADLRAFQKMLGDAVGIAVDALLLDEGSDRDADELKRIRNRKREAIESLAHVRDLLKATTSDIDEERLYGEEEYKRRKRTPPPQANEIKQSASPPPRPPEPAAAARLSLEHRRQRSSPSPRTSPSVPIASLPRTPAIIQQQRDPTPINRTLQAATLPRQRSGSSTSNPNPTPESDQPYRAPWNYTRSNFSTPSVDTAVLPRLPPRSSRSPVSLHSDSSTYPTNQVPARQVRKASNDPLGAIPS